MSKRYHVNPETGEAGVCRALKHCPFGGDEAHYRDLDYAREDYERIMEYTALLKNRNQSILETTTQSLNSDLSYRGKIPLWFLEYSERSVERTGVKPEILDVMDFQGKQIAVVWTEHSMDEVDYFVQERGFSCPKLYYKDLKTGENIGYLTVGLANDESLGRAFGEGKWANLAIWEEFSGTPYGNSVKSEIVNGEKTVRPKFETISDPTERLEEKKRFWAQIHKNSHHIPKSVNIGKLQWGMVMNLNETHAPENEEELDREINNVLSEADIYARTFKRDHGVPIIDYSRFEDDFKGKGLAASLYVYAGRKLGEKSMILSASGVQSDEAQKIWRRMAKQSDIPVKIVKKIFSYSNKETTAKTVLALDFTKENV